MSETIKATFGVDITPLKRGFAEAEQAAKTSAAKVSSALNSVQAGGRPTFRPFGQQQFDDFVQQRRNRNSAAGFAPAPMGKYPSPEDESTSTFRRIRGLGVGLTAIAALHELAGAFTKANEEAGKLEQTIIKLTAPTGAASGRSQSGIQSNLSGITDTLNQLRQRDLEELQGGERTPSMTLGHLVRRARQFLTGDSNANEDQQKDRLRKQAVQSIDDLASKQETLNRAEREGLSVSVRQSELLKAEIQHREKLGELSELESRLGINNKAARDEENNRFDLENEAIEKRFHLLALEQSVQARATGRETIGLTDSQQRTANLQDRIKFLQERFKSEPAENRMGTDIEITRTKNDLLREQYKNRFDGPALYTPEKGEAANFANWVKIQQRLNPDAAMGPKAAGSGSQLGSTGVLDRIEKNTAELGANR